MKKHEKILQSGYVDLINILIADGVSSRDISEALVKKDFYISHAAIANYANDYPQQSNAGTTETGSEINMSELLVRASGMDRNDRDKLAFKLKCVALLMAEEKLKSNTLQTKDIDQAKKLADLAKSFDY